MLEKHAAMVAKLCIGQIVRCFYLTGFHSIHLFNLAFNIEAQVVPDVVLSLLQ